MSRPLRAAIIFTACALGLARPAAATCMVRGETPQAGTPLALTAPSGKQTLKRRTDRKGALVLRGLQPGEWRVLIVGQPQPYKMVVAKDRKLVLSTRSVTVSCSPPGGPVRTSTSLQLKQLNRSALTAN